MAAAVTPDAREPLQRLLAQIVREHRPAAPAREMAAHRLAHHAEPNEPDARDRAQRRPAHSWLLHPLATGSLRTPPRAVKAGRAGRCCAGRAGESRRCMPRARNPDVLRHRRRGPGARGRDDARAAGRAGDPRRPRRRPFGLQARHEPARPTDAARLFRPSRSGPLRSRRPAHLHAGRERAGHGGAAPPSRPRSRRQHRHLLWWHGRDGARRPLSGGGLAPCPDRHRRAWRVHSPCPGDPGRARHRRTAAGVREAVDRRVPDGCRDARVLSPDGPALRPPP